MELALCFHLLGEFHGCSHLYLLLWSCVFFDSPALVDWYPSHPQLPKSLIPSVNIKALPWRSRVPHGPATASDNWLEMRIPALHSRYVELETPGVRPSHLCSKDPSDDLIHT